MERRSEVRKRKRGESENDRGAGQCAERAAMVEKGGW